MGLAQGVQFCLVKETLCQSFKIVKSVLRTMRMWAAFLETLHGTWDEQLLLKASGAKWLSPMQCSDRRPSSCLRILFFKYRKYFHISSSWSLFEAKSCIFQIRTEAFLGKATLEQTIAPSSPRRCLQQRSCTLLREKNAKAHRALSGDNLFFTPRVRAWLSLQSL